MYRTKCGLPELVVFSTLLVQTLLVQANYISPERVKRGIFGTVTSTVYTTIQEKHYVPASCVYLEPNLPDCRNVRFLNLPSFNQNAFFNNGNEVDSTSSDHNNGKEKNVEATKRVDVDQSNLDHSKTVYIQGWGEYLGFYRPTVTVTDVQIQPTTVLDPRVVVTYAIRGCKPHDLPQKLEKCPEEEPLELVEMIPTSTVHARIEPTKVQEMTSLATLTTLDTTEVDKYQVLPESSKPTENM